MEYIIRSASESDAEGINEVSEHLGYSQFSSTEYIIKFQELLSSTQDQIFLAEWQGRIIGWLHLFYARRLASDNFFEIGGLVVSPENRGHGVGRALVQYAQAKNLGKFRVRCNEKRLDAHKFYESIGFDSIKVQRVFQVRS